MTSPVGVTGATGFVGGMVARGLDGLGVQTRLVVRDASSPRLPQLEHVESVREATYGDLAASTRAFEGVSTLFLVSAGESADRVEQHRTAIDAAAAAGVEHVVYLSFLGASPDAEFTLARDHGATEQHLRASGMSWTFLRDSFYLDALVQFAGEDGVIRGPAGEGRVGGVARADVAGSAVAVLLDPAPHREEVYELTGPEALTLAEVAATVTEVTGRETTFHDETIPEAYESRAVYGVPDWQVDAWVSTYTAIASGALDKVTQDVARLTGHAPTTLRELLAG